MRTTPRISFGLFDLEIKQASTPSTTSPLQPWAKINDLKTDSATNRLYASYEPDFWLLDGEYKFLPTDLTTVHPGMVSLAMSGATGVFTTAPVLTVTFSAAQSSDGLALRFATYSGDYCNSITVAYYDAGNSLIRSDSYAPTGPEFSTNQAVSNFKKIVVAFNSTSRPYRYLRLTGIDYGELISFEGAAIKAATLTEETDQISAEVRSNAMDLGLYSNDPEFSILNPSGFYAALAERQPVSVYELVDGAIVFMGNYYLDTWSNESDTDYLFGAIDLLGILDRMTYRGGIWLGTGIVLEDLLEDVLGPISIPYELDNQLLGTAVKGWIPNCSYREALQQIAFAVGASVSCSRSSAVKIYKSRIAASEPANYAVTRAEKGLSQSLQLLPLVTAVEITAHNYMPGGEAMVVTSGSFVAGVHEIKFNEPMHSLSASGAAILEQGVNYARIAVAIPGTVTLSGLKYIDTQSPYSIVTPGLSPTVRPNVIKVEAATLVHSGNVAAVAERVYAYHAQRYRQKMKLYAPSIETGSVTVVDTLYSKQIRGVVEKMEVDLAKGMVAQVQLTGVQHGMG